MSHNLIIAWICSTFCMALTRVHNGNEWFPWTNGIIVEHDRKSSSTTWYRWKLRRVTMQPEWKHSRPLSKYIHVARDLWMALYQMVWVDIIFIGCLVLCQYNHHCLCHVFVFHCTETDELAAAVGHPAGSCVCVICCIVQMHNCV